MEDEVIIFIEGFASYLMEYITIWPTCMASSFILMVSESDDPYYIFIRELVLNFLINLDYRFHKLAEFDEGKRSCRKRLAGHNERRRKPQFDTHLSKATNISILHLSMIFFSVYLILRKTVYWFTTITLQYKN